MDRETEDFLFLSHLLPVVPADAHLSHYNNEIQLTCTLEITLIPLASHKDGNRPCIVLLVSSP